MASFIALVHLIAWEQFVVLAHSAALLLLFCAGYKMLTGKPNKKHWEGAQRANAFRTRRKIADTPMCPGSLKPKTSTQKDAGPNCKEHKFCDA